MVFIDNANASYDKLAKQILSRKVILSRILKHCLPEFAKCSIEEIENKYIEGEAKINIVPLDDTLDIRGGHTESASPNEGLVTFDVIVDVIAPTTKEPIKLIINLEPQKTTRVKYPVTKRAIYYASRLISSQKEKIFTGEQYGKIRKIYSIWVVMSTSGKRSNSIQRFEITQKVLHGTWNDNRKNYDLMTIIMLNLGEGEMSDELLKLLHLLFLDMLKSEQKEVILQEEYGITLTRDMRKELKAMSGLMQPAVDMAARKAAAKAAEEARAIALEEGKDVGIKEGTEKTRLSSIRNLMKNMKWTAQQAMEALGIPTDEQPKYAALI